MPKRKNGDGNWTQLASGKWRYRKAVLINGEICHFDVTRKTQKECRLEVELRIKMAFDKNEYNADMLTLTELCYKQLDFKIHQKCSLAEKSIDREEDTIRNQIEAYPIGGIQVNALTAADVSEHIESLIFRGCSHSSVRKAWDVINSSFNWAIRQELLGYNPCERIKDVMIERFKKLKLKQNYSKFVSILSEMEQQILKENAMRMEDDKYYYRGIGPMVSFMIDIGIRAGECCALKWKDYHEDTNSIEVIRKRAIVRNRDGIGANNIEIESELKNLKRRELALFPGAIEVLKSIKANSKKTEPDDYIFLNGEGKPYNPKTVDDRLKTFYRDCGFNRNLISGAHILRRTFATNRYREGADIESIAAYLGDTVETVNKCYINHSVTVVVEGRSKDIVALPIKK